MEEDELEAEVDEEDAAVLPVPRLGMFGVIEKLDADAVDEVAEVDTSAEALPFFRTSSP